MSDSDILLLSLLFTMLIGFWSIATKLDEILTLLRERR
jgi:hypothetical protein